MADTPDRPRWMAPDDRGLPWYMPLVRLASTLFLVYTIQDLPTVQRHAVDACAIFYICWSRRA